MKCHARGIVKTGILLGVLPQPECGQAAVPAAAGVAVGCAQARVPRPPQAAHMWRRRAAT